MPTSSREDFVNGLVSVQPFATARLEAGGAAAENRDSEAIAGQPVGGVAPNARPAAGDDSDLAGGPGYSCGGAFGDGRASQKHP